MKRVFLSLIYTGVTAAPLFMTDLVGAWKWHVLSGYCALVLLSSWFLTFAPDKRFERVRKDTLEALFKAKFKSVSSGLHVNERPPLRCNVMCPSCIWPRKKLAMHYLYNVTTSDADYKMIWPRGSGLCWKVLLTGRPEFFKKGNDLSDYGMSEEQIKKTEHILALLCLPLKAKNTGRIVGVLNIDALRPEAAEDLEELVQKLRDHKDMQLVDLVNLVGLYFS